MSLWALAAWWRESRQRKEEPDSGYPQVDFTDRTPEGLDCPDTEPTSPGALDTLPGRLE